MPTLHAARLRDLAGRGVDLPPALELELAVLEGALDRADENATNATARDARDATELHLGAAYVARRKGEHDRARLLLARAIAKGPDPLRARALNESSAGAGAQRARGGALSRRSRARSCESLRRSRVARFPPRALATPGGRHDTSPMPAQTSEISKRPSVLRTPRIAGSRTGLSETADERCAHLLALLDPRVSLETALDSLRLAQRSLMTRVAVEVLRRQAPSRLRFSWIGDREVLVGATLVDLRRAPVLVRVLGCLAEVGEEGIDAEALLVRAWPDERLVRRRAIHRAHGRIREPRVLGVPVSFVDGRYRLTWPVLRTDALPSSA